MSDEKKHAKLKPTTLRPLLAVALFGAAGLTVFGFVVAQQKLNTYAIEVSHKKIDASASKASLQTLQSIEKQLAKDKETVEKAKNIKHVSNLPQFKAIQDLKNHAIANGIGLSDISFAASGETAPAATGGAAAAPLTTPAVTAGEGIDISFKINDGQVAVLDLVRFLYDIEHSTPKLQINGITVTKGATKDHVMIETMTVRMFTKQA